MEHHGCDHLKPNVLTMCPPRASFLPRSLGNNKLAGSTSQKAAVPKPSRIVSALRASPYPVHLRIPPA